MDDRARETRVITITADNGEKNGTRVLSGTFIRSDGLASNPAKYRFSDKDVDASSVRVGDTITVAVEKSEYQGRYYLWVKEVQRQGAPSGNSEPQTAPSPPQGAAPTQSPELQAFLIAGRVYQGSCDMEGMIIAAVDLMDAMADPRGVRGVYLAKRSLGGHLSDDEIPFGDDDA